MVIKKPSYYLNTFLLIIWFFWSHQILHLIYFIYWNIILHISTISNLMIFSNLIWLFKNVKYLVSKSMVSYLNFEWKIELFFIETMSKISAISSFVHKSIIPPSPRFSYLAVRSANMRVEILVILCIKKVMTAKAKLLSEIIISQNCTTYVPWSQTK